MVENKGKLRKGADQAIKNCLATKKGERVLIITDEKSKNIAKHFELSSKEITKKVNYIVLENITERPMKKIPQKLINKIKESDVCLLLVQKEENEMHIRKEIRLTAKNNKVRFANIPGITKKVVKQGLNTNHSKIWNLSKKLYKLLKKSKTMEVQTKKGTNLKINLGHKWITADGDLRKLEAQGTNLPGGEIYTAPKNVNGKAIIDGVLGDHFSEKYGLINKTPLSWEIENGKVKNINCKNKKLENEFKKYMDSDQNGHRIGEVALGINNQIKKPIGVMIQDEKLPTFHMAVGNPYGQATGANWKSNIHCDGVIKKATVFLEGKKILENGKYLI